MIDSLEKDYLKQLNSNKIYLRFFDIDWNSSKKQAVPLAETSFTDYNTSSLSLTIVPTIFITNRTMINISYDDIKVLGDRIIQKIRQKCELISIHNLQEIQLDCDWSSKSQLNYFHLLDYLKKQYKLKVSTTVRLHQYKYPDKTGTPPADQGVLMIYNMGDIRDATEQNSILNLKAASAYLNHTSNYPIPLQVALPLFSWGVLRRQGKVIDLIPEINPNALQNSSKLQHLEGNNFEVQSNHYFQSVLLYKGDKIRIEQVSQEDLEEVSRLIRKNMAYDSLEIYFYHLNSNVLKNYSHADLMSIKDILQN